MRTPEYSHSLSFDARADQAVSVQSRTEVSGPSGLEGSLSIHATLTSVMVIG